MGAALGVLLLVGLGILATQHAGATATTTAKPDCGCDGCPDCQDSSSGVAVTQGPNSGVTLNGDTNAIPEATKIAISPAPMRRDVSVDLPVDGEALPTTVEQNFAQTVGGTRDPGSRLMFNL